MSFIYCNYNFDAAPSTLPGVCTHLNNFRRDNETVSYCKNLQIDICK